MLSLGRKPLDFFFFPGHKVAEARVGDSPFPPCRGLKEAPWLTVYRVIGVSVKAELSLAKRTRKRVVSSFNSLSQTDGGGAGKRDALMSSKNEKGFLQIQLLMNHKHIYTLEDNGKE